ncbi:uncharacterized protein LOC129582604 isoform X2 [Paramacrobiotus metropolitanus]|uniref:uncharacterized protein LOC129582604 isoform X2 n=1 Tax=Paramacrobiotus metropolitanus TaxID=2943436 RepID=UPI002445F36A|nr:uncharacterized protein LOC129582604 isoform X2 [Paramacrobiotus metropolitanus]
MDDEDCSQGCEWELADGGRPRSSRFNRNLHALQEHFRQLAITTSRLQADVMERANEANSALLQEQQLTAANASFACPIGNAEAERSSSEMDSTYGSLSSESVTDIMMAPGEIKNDGANAKKKKVSEENDDEKKRRRVDNFFGKMSVNKYVKDVESGKLILQLESVPILDGSAMIIYTVDRIIEKVMEDWEDTTMWADMCAKLVQIERQKVQPKSRKSGICVTFENRLKERMQKEFGSGAVDQVGDMDIHPLEIVRQEKRNREIYMSKMHFLSLLFCHKLIPATIIMCCIKKLLPPDEYSVHYDEDKMEAACILVKRCVPFMYDIDNSLYKRLTREQCEGVFSKAELSQHISPLLRSYIRNARYAWDEKPDKYLLRVFPDERSMLMPAPRAAVVCAAASAPEPSSDIADREMRSLSRRMSVCRMESHSRNTGASKSRKTRSARRKRVPCPPRRIRRWITRCLVLHRYRRNR